MFRYDSNNDGVIEYDELVKLMDEYLTRESDRNVFGLDYDKESAKKSE